METPSKVISEVSSDNFKMINRLGRYNICSRITNEDGYTYLATPTKIIIRETAEDSFYSVDKGHEDRLDLISYEFYGTPLLWWAIAIMNNISNPFDVKAGLVLRIPVMRSITDSGGLKINA